jgi:hypothetical protein
MITIFGNFLSMLRSFCQPKKLSQNREYFLRFLGENIFKNCNIGPAFFKGRNSFQCSFQTLFLLTKTILATKIIVQSTKLSF